ncbi:MAG: hypothetical protein HXX09_10125 [Bacteroidetes bacterium]|nr:hypothetical protein [Bacteroidota bacterium]
MVKRLLIYTVAVLFIIVNSGCNKEEKLSIKYPSSGAYGENILSLPVNSNLTNINGYSLCAELGKKAELKIIITKLSGSGEWFYADGNGWTVSSYSGSSQQFESNKDGTIDLDLIFENGPGSCKVDFYENSSSVTDSKTFSW